MIQPQNTNIADLLAEEKLLEFELKEAGELLKLLKTEVGPMGLAPDSIRFSPEYLSAKQRSGNAFKRLQAFNIRTKKYHAQLRDMRRVQKNDRDPH